VLTYNPIDINELVDIQNIIIDSSLPAEEKKKSYLQQIKNPNCFRCGDIIVRVSFSNTGVTFEDRIKQYLLSGQGMELVIS